MAQAGLAIWRGRIDTRLWRGLAARAVLCFGALSVALSLALIVGHAMDVRRLEEQAIVARATQHIATLSERLADGALTIDGFEHAVEGRGLAYAYLRDDAGAVLAGAPPDRTAHGALIPQPAPRSGGPSTVVAGDVVHIEARVEQKGRALTLRVGLSLAPAASAGQAAAARDAVVALMFLALALPALAFAVDRAAARMRALARGPHSPGAAETALRLVGGRGDEVGAIVRTHAAFARDLAENADALRRLTFDDPLTCLPNRASLMSRLSPLLQLERPAALLKIEVDGLRRVAEAMGQNTSDEGLRKAAERIVAVAEDCARRAGADGDRSYLVAKLSDACFAVLAPDADAKAVAALADALFAAFRAPIELNDIHVSATLSIGVAVAPQDGEDAGAVLRSASAACASARAAGAWQVRFAGVELSRAAYGRLKLEESLRQAIADGAIELNYQPQVRLADGAATGAEALARWRHPTRGMISPTVFVPVAEECELIEPLGRLVLDAASRRAAEWRDAGLNLRMSVNISPVQFAHAGFAAEALRILSASGVDPAMIELEITESAAMRDPVHAARELAPLKEAGVRIAIDDFGTGYSNLAALTRLPIDVLKIDRGFVRAAASEPGALAAVHAVVGLARSLGFETVAEGVETEEQRDLVIALGASRAQGNLYGGPMDALAFEGWWIDRRIIDMRALKVRGHQPDRAASEAARRA